MDQEHVREQSACGTLFKGTYIELVQTSSEPAPVSATIGAFYIHTQTPGVDDLSA